MTPDVHQDPLTRRLHPRVKLVWWIGGVASDAVLVGVLTLIALVVARSADVDVPTWAPVVPVGVLFVAIAARSWYTRAAYRAWRYRFTADALEVEHGVFWRAASSMPYHRLQQVDVSQGPLERRFQMSSVRLRSAAATTDATIPGVADAEVDEIRERVMRATGRDDGA